MTLQFDENDENRLKNRNRLDSVLIDVTLQMEEANKRQPINNNKSNTENIEHS